MCPYLNLSPGIIPSTEATEYGTTVILTCDLYLTFPDGSTSRTIVCLGTGQWSASVEACSGRFNIPRSSIKIEKMLLLYPLVNGYT